MREAVTVIRAEIILRRDDKLNRSLDELPVLERNGEMKMIYTEIKMDLFAKENDAELLHCISSDFALGAGIAKQFAARGIKNKLQTTYVANYWFGHGYALRTGHIWNLVTKERYFHKPTYQTIEEALEDCLQQMLVEEAPKNIRPIIALPKIGCGLDRLEWEKVRPIIQRVFADTDFTICVCEYP